MSITSPLTVLRTSVAAPELRVPTPSHPAHRDQRDCDHLPAHGKSDIRPRNRVSRPHHETEFRDEGVYLRSDVRSVLGSSAPRLLGSSAPRLSSAVAR